MVEMVCEKFDCLISNTKVATQNTPKLAWHKSTLQWKTNKIKHLIETKRTQFIASMFRSYKVTAFGKHNFSSPG